MKAASRKRGPPAQKTVKAVLFTGYACNNRCGFCIDYDKRLVPDRTTSELLVAMSQARALGADYLEIIGGEATIRTDFFPLVKAARNRGFLEISVATNGRRFAYPDFAQDALCAGITSVIFSIHGPTAKMHDALTQVPGSFSQLLAGIRNLQHLGFDDIRANTTVVRRNCSSLADMGRLYLELGLKGVEVIFVDPTCGGVHRDFNRWVPRISKAAPLMRACLDIGRAAGARDWAVRYVPLCHFRGYEAQVSETIERRVFHTIHLAPDFTNLDVSGSRVSLAREKPARCGGCSAYESCEGIWKEYLRVYGAAELNPF